MRTIEIDEEVWRELQNLAQPLIDSPNSVLRRVLDIDTSSSGGKRTLIPLDKRQVNMETKTHSLRSKMHRTPNREIWWYGIPPLGNKYQPGHRITFFLDEFAPKRSGQFSIELKGHFLDQIDRAEKDKKGYTHVKIWREPGGPAAFIYFGQLEPGERSEKINVI